jgi:glycosyltransferase involved in cell wall biosynthesis
VDGLVTFVVPTVGRGSLVGALDSLRRQSDGDWCCWVVKDSVEGWPDLPDEIADDKRIQFMAARRGSAGLARNVALPYVSTKWTAFLDDDDTLAPDYVKWLREYGATADVVVFRMYHPELGVLPPVGMTAEELRWGQVGISFAVRTAYFASTEDPSEGLRFIAERDPDSHEPGRAMNEDIKLIEELRDAHARFHITDEIGYYVGGQEWH